MLDAILLVAQHGPSVIPILSSPPSESSSVPSRASPTGAPTIQGYLTQPVLLSALTKFSGLQWFDEVLRRRTLSQVAQAAMDDRPFSSSIVSGASLEAALVQLFRSGQAALPVVEQAAEGRDLMVGQVTHEDALRLVSEPGLFPRRR